MAKLQAQVYHVDVKPIDKLDIETETKRSYVEDGKIKIQTKIKVTDSVDIKDSVESMADGKIKPYGLDTPAGYDVEIKEKVEPSVIQEHIDKTIKKQTKKK